MDALLPPIQRARPAPAPLERIRLSGPPSGAGARPLTNAELVEALCLASTPLREARRVHLQTYGILIPHVFMSDVLHRIGQCLGARRLHLADGSQDGEMEGILAALERGMAQGERETRNVIAISFARDSELEMFFEELRPLMGPRTRAQLQGR